MAVLNVAARKRERLMVLEWIELEGNREETGRACRYASLKIFTCLVDVRALTRKGKSEAHRENVFQADVPAVQDLTIVEAQAGPAFHANVGVEIHRAKDLLGGGKLTGLEIR